jgi:hypothetical protein
MFDDVGRGKQPFAARQFILEYFVSDIVHVRCKEIRIYLAKQWMLLR